MKKMLITIIFAITSIAFICPINVNAFSMDNYKEVASQTNILTRTDIDLDDYNQDQNCSGGDSILGDPTDEDSVAWLVQQILNVIKVVGPILTVLLSSIDFIYVIVKSDDEQMQKAQKKLITRLILAVLLFLIPTLVQVILSVFGIVSDPTCGLQ